MNLLKLQEEIPRTDSDGTSCRSSLRQAHDHGEWSQSEDQLQLHEKTARQPLEDLKRRQ